MVKFKILCAVGLLVSGANGAFTTVPTETQQVQRKYIPVGTQASAEAQANFSGLTTLDSGHPAISSGITAQAVTALAVSNSSTFPSSLDISGGFPPIFDQGQLGSCTANAFVACVMYNLNKQTGTMPPLLSRLFLYYCERALENKTATDSGACILDGLLALSTTGICSEADWPYIEQNFAEAPPATAHSNAPQCKISKENDASTSLPMTARVSNSQASIKSILNKGYPVVWDLKVFEELESISVLVSGKLTMPSNTTCLGGHTTVIVGYDDSKSAFLVRNSWGSSWGTNPSGNILESKGYFWAPYEYVDHFTQNLLTIGPVTVPNFTAPTQAQNANTSFLNCIYDLMAAFRSLLRQSS